MQKSKQLLDMENQNLLEKENILIEAGIKLKEKFFGIDNEINQIIDGISSWYHFPEFQTRPLVINLWGMTGVGKSDLVRELVRHIQVENYFFEFDCGELNSKKLILTFENLEIMETPLPVVVMLDEFQLLDNVSQNRKTKITDEPRVIWRLLDDGKIEKTGFFKRSTESLEKCYLEFCFWIKEGLKIEKGMVSNTYSDFLELRGHLINVPKDLGESGFDKTELSQFVFGKEELTILAENLKNEFKSIPEVVAYVKTLDEVGVLQMVTRAWERTLRPEILDLSHSLIFVVGNLDEAYSFAKDQTADISPDDFYKLSRKIKLPHVKMALKTHFKNEQISRLGNNHVIYPGLNSEAYRKIIEAELNKIAEIFLTKAGIPLEFDESVPEWLFEEGVAATQGARPLLSTIRYSIGDLIPKMLFFYLKSQRRAVRVRMSVGDGDGMDVLYLLGEKALITAWFPMASKIKKLKKNRGDEFQAIVAVHESGHAILHFLTTGKPPKKVCSVSSDPDLGGFVFSDFEQKITTYDRLQKEVMVSLGGFIAEQLVFGEGNVSTGSAYDFETVTENVVFMFKECGFGRQPFKIAKSTNELCNSIHKTRKVEKDAESFIKRSFEESQRILKREEKLLVETAKILLQKPQLEKDEFMSLISEFGTAELLQESGQNGKTFKEMLFEKSDQLVVN